MKKNGGKAINKVNNIFIFNNRIFLDLTANN